MRPGAGRGEATKGFRMNKTALGFGIGLVLLAGAAVAYLAIVGGEAPAPTAAPDTKAAVEKPAPEAAPKPAPKEVAETMPEPPKIPQPSKVTPTKLTLLRTVPDAVAYADKEVLDVMVRIEQREGNDPVRAMGMQEEIPAGYALESFDGPRQPDVKPPAGTRGTLEFAWFQFPEGFFPADFSYKIKKVGDPGATPQFSGQALYRTSGEELRTDVVKSLLGTGAGSEPAPAPAAPAPADPAAAPAATPAEAPAAVAAEAAAPMPDPISVPVSVDANVMLGRAAKSPAYTPGTPIEVDVVLEYEGTATLGAVAVVDKLPPGWTFEGVAGANVPPIKPAQGAQGNLSFIFIDVPTFPATFTYTVKPSADSAGEQQIKGKVVYRAQDRPFEGAELVTAIPQQ